MSQAVRLFYLGCAICLFLYFIEFYIACFTCVLIAYCGIFCACVWILFFVLPVTRHHFIDQLHLGGSAFAPILTATNPGPRQQRHRKEKHKRHAREHQVWSTEIRGLVQGRKYAK